jgi:CheY-like chemotaxis protein
VMGMLELIAEGSLTQLQYDYVRACRSSADRLLRTVENVSEFLNPENEKTLICDFDLQEAVASVTSLMETLAHRKGLSLSHETRLRTPRRVAGDHDRIQDILFRLLDNAIRFTDHGQVQLIVTKSRQDSTGIGVQFDVCDTGPGISADTIARVLRPPSEILAWHGLGLPIVRKFILAMGGELSIRSREGGGSCVSVSLPLKMASMSAIRATEPGRVDDDLGPAVPLNILVAEDSDDSYYVLESYLREQHYQMTRAVDGTRAIELFKAGHFDLVLMDVHMPGVDGYSATRAIREWETRRTRARIPIVILSSDSSRTQIQNGAKVGCSGYLTKPVSKVALLNVLRRYARTGPELA